MDIAIAFEVGLGLGVLVALAAVALLKYINGTPTE